jgi:hypothetical protein
MKRILILSLLLIGFSVIAQEKEKLQYKSFSVSPGIFSNEGKSGGGFSLSSELSYQYYKNIFSISASVGAQPSGGFVIGVVNPDSFEQVNVLYGREFNLWGTTFFELHGGTGYFSFKSIDIDLTNLGYDRKTTLGFPIMAKLKFRSGENFSWGFQAQQNINAVNRLLTVGVLLHWDHRNEKEAL